jgi:hypothetical protein
VSAPQYLEPAKFSPAPHVLILAILYPESRVHLSSFTISTICLVHHILLNLIRIIIGGQQMMCRFSLNKLLLSPFTFSFLGPDILPSALFLKVGEQVSHSRKTTIRIILCVTCNISNFDSAIRASFYVFGG